MSERNRLGIADLARLAVIIGLTLVIFFLLNALGFLHYVVTIKGTVDFVVSSDDKGTMLVSLLQAGSEKPYSEVFAELCIKGGADRMKTELGTLEKELNSLEKKLNVYSTALCYPEQRVNLGDESVRTQIALPGGRTGYIEIGDNK